MMTELCCSSSRPFRRAALPKPAFLRACAGIFAAVWVTACGGGTPAAVSTAPPPVPPPVSTAPPDTEVLAFSNQSFASGLSFSAGFSEDYTDMPRHFAGGAAAGDIDNDGDIDVLVLRGNTQPNLLFQNDGGVFTNIADGLIANPNGGTANYKLSGPSFSDMDGDGHLDIFMGGMDGDPSLIFKGAGDGTFEDVSTSAGLGTMTSRNTVSAAFGDYDQDGDMDLALAHWGTPRSRLSPGETETLWRNQSQNGTIMFEPVSEAAAISAELALTSNGALGPDHDYTFSPNFADINDDGWPDLLSVADFAGSRVFINNQDGTFSNVTDTTQIIDSNGMGSAVGDYDNDGDVDWFVSSIDGNRLYENMDGTLINVTDFAGIAFGGWGWGSCFADFNLDGHLDIYQTNGWIENGGANPAEPFTRDRSRLWIADGDKRFTDEAGAIRIDDETQGRGVICADFDGDNDTDILLLISDADQGAIYWRNDSAAAHSVTLTFDGPPPNTAAIGTRVFITIGDIEQMREISAGSNFTSQNPPSQIIGMGEADIIDRIRVQWPDGTRTQMTDITAGQRLNISHPAAQ